MISYDKKEIKEALTVNDINEVLQDWGGEPMLAPFGIISATICHNPPGEGSKKLYYYENSGLFRCYTGCADEIFDVFELYIKVQKIQHNIECDLNEAVRAIAHRFGLSGTMVEDPQDKLKDWDLFSSYNRIQALEIQDKPVLNLKPYDDVILDRLNYDLKLTPWLNEGMTQEVLDLARIGYFPGGDQITIPHFDAEGNFVGLRGRIMSEEEGQKFGKYRPLVINRETYNHPLGMNLYNLNNAKAAIKTFGKAIVYESEKSTLLHASYFGWENNMSVACCGSNLSAYQVQLLIEAGAKEIVIAFDKQFQSIGDDEYKIWVRKLTRLHDKFKSLATISIIFDKFGLTDYKASPIDHGPQTFTELYNQRIFLK